MLTSPRHAYNDPDYQHMFSRRLFVALLTAAASSIPGTAGAQAVTGLGEDATLPPAGSLRLRVQSEWTYYDQRYVTAAGQSGSGTLQPLGATFTLDTLGARQLPILRPLQDSLTALSGVPGLSVSLGRTRAQITDRITQVPITLEAGISRWLSISATVPIVHTVSNVFFSANPTGTEGNIGINPALTDGAALASDTAFAQQILRSAAAVQAYCTGSGANTSQCAGATGFASSATVFARSVATLYGAGVFVPTRRSNLQGAVDTRAQAYRNSLNSFASIAGSGVPSVSAAGVVGAATSLATPDIQHVLSDTAFGVQLDPLQTVSHTHIGDVEVAAKLALFDSFRSRGMSRFEPHGVNARVSVEAGYRFPTGEVNSADNLTDIGTGTHESALLLRGYTDVIVGRHFWASLVARQTRQMASDVTIRYASPDVVFPTIGSRQTVQRQLGNLTEIEASPRWVFNDFVSLGGQYLYRRKAADSYSVAGAIANNSASSGTTLSTFDPLEFAAGSDFTEHSVGGGLVFSNAHAVQMGRSRFPFDVSYLHSETIRGSGGKVPKLITDQIQIRVYRRVHR